MVSLPLYTNFQDVEWTPMWVFKAKNSKHGNTVLTITKTYFTCIEHLSSLSFASRLWKEITKTCNNE